MPFCDRRIINVYIQPLTAQEKRLLDELVSIARIGKVG
jgi:hypothetical protein